MSHLRAVPSADEQPRPRSGSATSVRVEAPGRVPLFVSRVPSGDDGEPTSSTVYQAVRIINAVTARRQAADAHGAVTLTPEDTDQEPLCDNAPAARAARALADAVGVTEGVDLLLRRRVPRGCGLGGGSAQAAATLVACNQLWGTGLSQAELLGIAAGLGTDVGFPLIGACAVGHGQGRCLSPLMTRGTYQWVLALPREPLEPTEVYARHDALTRADGAARPPAAEPVREAPDALTAALRAGDAAALAPLLHNDLQETVLSLRPALADVIALAQQAGALRALVAGTGPAVAALVAEPGTAARVTRALRASGLIASAVRVDAPVAGARVVG